MGGIRGEVRQGESFRAELVRGDAGTERRLTLSSSKCGALQHEIDVEDPPLPPPRPADLPGDIQTPFESRAFSPPASYNEAARQAVVDHLDLFGTKTKRKASQQTLAIQMQPSASTDSAMRSGDSSLQRTGSTTSTGRDQSDAASLTGSTRTHATIQAETVGERSPFLGVATLALR